ncbi:PrgI family protein [Brevibacillus centrosporus]|uniref:PrgI family mobile element protein n=1 Tax=Brevibacillus centrosporus TaxID=54910 RepID=UPI001142E5DF|nr:PrgI family protein [Brevibacillus centrosporus]MEC2133320.1 PrgI family protein [Brevibacillus centrosporus]GED33924.1 hypothetical protein BCE02nite_50650 [Brevibacillus centrosporus]
MKVNVVHVDIVSEEKDVMGRLSWRQFYYCAAGLLIAYNVAKPILVNNPTFDTFMLLFMFLFTPLILLIWAFGFLYLETPDMYFDRWLVYWLIGKKENSIYLYMNADEEEN